MISTRIFKYVYEPFFLELKEQIKHNDDQVD